LEDYSFHEQLPDGVTFGFEISLFNDSRHLALQSADGWNSFYAINHKHQRADAIFSAHLREQVARSLLKSPFGGFEFSDDLPLPVLFQFISFIEARLKSKGAASIVIKNPPHDYTPENASLIEVFLVNHGYQTADAEAGCILHAHDPRLEINTWEKRKLRQAIEAGLSFRQLSLERFDEVYFFILACRKKKNYELSMTLADLRHAISYFPDRYILFVAEANEKIVAASISVKVKEKILYNFYVDHDQEWDHLSPVVFLIEKMYRFVQENKMDALDLGTAALDGKPNFGLLDFKIRLGGKATTKFTFRKILN